MNRLTSIFQDATKNGESFEQSIKYALEASLVSPHFLFRGELQPDSKALKPIQDLDEYALATRLAYFLWSTMPDDELFALAAKGNLRKNLDKQIPRMLADSRSKALTENFAAQIRRQIRNLAHVTPAHEAYSRFDDELRVAMETETKLYFQYVLSENRSLLEFIDSDYTFLNERLAKHYGIPNVAGKDFKRVLLKIEKSRRHSYRGQYSLTTLPRIPPAPLL